MDLQPGQNLLHYRIVEKIGEGGMGEVWKATDTTLDREVAIKFIPEQFAGEDERLARFVREAKMLATLNHPNIAAVYGLHEAEGSHFIAMELVPGEDLAERLVRGPLSVEDTIDVCRQVAEALEAAHEQGVIHRDLKPANIKRTPDGKIKVLDLGLAKALGPEMSGESASVSLSPTMTSAGTVAGTLLGTAAYMSPEQAKGKPADRRADIWAFGVVMHEMLTGRKLFDAETVSETLAALLRDEVSMETLPPNVPASVKRLMQRCLDREPRTRLRDIGEARIALSPEALTAEPVGADSAAGTVAPTSTGGGMRLLPWALVALLAAVAVFAMTRGTSESAGERQALTLVAPIPADRTLPGNQMGVMALSPDGKTLAMTLGDDANQIMLYVRPLDRPDLVQIPGTENATTPFFSPDGQWIGFFSDDKLKKVAVTGGSPVTLCDSDGNNRGADWGTDDVIVFSPHYTKPLMRVSGAGGEPQMFTTIDTEKGERTHRWPHAVAGEDLVLFTVGTMDSPESYDGARIQAIRPSTGEQRTILERASMARYVPSGHLVFGREGFLFAVPFDVETLEVLGSPVPVVEEVMGMNASGVVHAGFAANGLLAYIAGAPQLRNARLAWRTRDGATLPLAAPVAGYLNPRISPDRTRIASQVGGTSTFDIWVYSIEQETSTRLTFEGDNNVPVWSPDGRRISFSSVRDGRAMSAFVKAADGSGQAEIVCDVKRFGDAGQVTPTGWTSADGPMLVTFTNQNGINLGTCPEREGEVGIFLETPAVETHPTLSPNGRRLAYSSDESGRFEIYVRDFPGPGGKWQVSTSGGVLPRWSPDGGELFYRHRRSLYAAAIDARAESFKAGRPEVVFDDLRPSTGLSDYDVFDSDRILLIETAGGETQPAGVTVVANWLDQLNQKVPN